MFRELENKDLNKLRGLAFIEPGLPWDNGYNSPFCDELLFGEIFYSLAEAAESSKSGAGSTRPSDRIHPGDPPPALEVVSRRSANRISCACRPTVPPKPINKQE